jgi:hypothetical protein
MSPSSGGGFSWVPIYIAAIPKSMTKLPLLRNSHLSKLSSQVARGGPYICIYIYIYSVCVLVTVAARSKAWTVSARSGAGIVGSNPTLGLVVWCVCVCVCVYAFILCLCWPVFRQRPCDELTTRLRSPTVCEKWLRSWIRGQGPEWAVRSIENYIYIYIYISVSVPVTYYHPLNRWTDFLEIWYEISIKVPILSHRLIDL